MGDALATHGENPTVFRGVTLRRVSVTREVKVLGHSTQMGEDGWTYEGSTGFNGFAARLPNLHGKILSNVSAVYPVLLVGDQCLFF
jgi:hypothetical protein